MFYKIAFLNIYRKTPLREYHFHKVLACKCENLLKKRLRHRCFPVTFVKFQDFTQFFPMPVSVLSLLQTCKKENFVIYVPIFTLLSLITYNHFIIFWDFLMFYQIFFSPQGKRCTIITYKHGTYELPHELTNDLRH